MAYILVYSDPLHNFPALYMQAETRSRNMKTLLN